MTSTVRTESLEYRGYQIDLTEWCGAWQPRLWPLAPRLRGPADEQLVAATAPSRDEALEKTRHLIDWLIDPEPWWKPELPEPPSSSSS